MKLLALASLLALGVLAGCHGQQNSAPAPGNNGAAPSASSPAPPAAASQPSSKVDAQRQELAQIAPPAKGRYISIQHAASWQNPFIEVGTHTLKVTVLVADPNPVSAGAGGIMRPAGARRTIQEIRTADLGEMLTALPSTAWPYGRVVAVEESQQDARRDRVQMRRNYEAAMQILGNLGVVINEWNEVGR